MGSHRSEEKINIDILQVILDKRGKGEKARQQSLIYGANLNFPMFRKYKSRLLDAGFITEDMEGRNRVYDITSRGIDYLREGKSIERALHPLMNK